MARLPRLNLPGVPQHLIQRGNNRTPCFYHEQDYAYYLDTLHKYSQKYDVDIHAYVLMTNHVHILLTLNKSKGVSQMMQSLARLYVRYINTTISTLNHYGSSVLNRHLSIVLNIF